MPDKKINLSGAKEILSSEGPKLNLSGASDILKKKDQSVAAATGGFGSQLGSQTFQPTKAFVPTPLVGTGVEDYNKEQKAKAQAKKDLSQKLQSQQDIYYQAQGKQSAISMYDNYQSSIKDIDDEISKNYPEAATGPRTQSGAEDFNKYDTKRGQLVSQRDQFSQQSKSALKYINPIIESDINTEFENNGLKKFTRVTSAGFEVPDEYKIDDYAKKYAQQNGVSDNGTFKRLVYDKLKSSVAFNISKPKIQKEFDELFKKEFGVTPDKAIQKDYLDNFAEGEKIKSNLLFQVQSLNKDIKTKLDDGSKLLSSEYKPRLDAITADYQNRAASIELKIKQLNESYKSGVIPKQSYDLAFNNIQNELTVLNSQYKDSFDSVSKEFLNNQNELYSKYDKRYKRQVSEFTNMAEQQIADASSKYGKTFKMSDDLKKKYESVWNKATNKYLTKDEAIKYDLERSFIPGNLGTQFAKNLFIGIGSGIKSISSMYDFDAGYVFGDYMENSVTSSSPEIKTGLDLLDPIKLQSSVGRMLGGMAPVLGASALTAAATKNAPTALRLLATGLGNYIVETAQIGGGIKDTVFQKTGNIADANKAAKKAVDANLYLLPLYALDGLPFLDDVTLGIKNTFARAGAKAGIETLTELPQEYFQNIFEDLAISDKPISDTFKNMTLEKFENTALNVIPTTVLLGGAGTAFKGAKEEIAKIQGRSFAAKFDLFDLTKTAKKQFVYDTVLRRGDVFAKAYVSSLFNSGNINEQELESFSNMINESNKIIEESKKIGLGKVGSKVYAALKFDYIQSKNEFDSEQDEASKKIYKAKMDSAEKSLNDFVSGKKPDAVVLTLPNNEQYIYSFETLNSIIDEGGDLLNQIIDGDVKVGLLTDKTNPKAKALSDKLNKIKKENAVQEPSTTSEVPPTTEGGQVIPEGGEGMGQSIKGTEAPQEIKPEEEVVTEEPVVEPAKQETPKADKEVERLQSDLFRTEIELEDAELEIENEKSNLKEEKARIKQAIADVRKSNLSREEKEDKIEDLKYELEDLIDTHDSLVENYKLDIQDAKKEIAKINKKLKKIAQAPVTPVAPTTAKAKGVSSKNKSQLDDLKSRVTNAVKSTVIKTAERAIVTLKSILPEFDIIIHEDEDSYNRATGNPNTRGNFSYEVNPDGTYSGRIDINLNKANERTVAHEVAHAVLLKVFGENTKLFKEFRFKISKVLNSSRNKELVKFANLYGTDVKAEEYLVELTSILEQEQDKISPTVLQQVAAIINDLVSKLTNGAIKPFENVRDTKDIIDFFNTVSGAIREGKEISEDGSKFKKFGEQVAKGPESKSKFQANFTDDKTGITFSYDENGDLFKELVNKGYITYDKTIEDFLGQSAVFHKPDYAFSGNILKDGVVIIEGQGGIYYPIKYHKDGLFWAASTPEAAKGLVKKINEAAKNSPDGKARLILISTSEDKVFSSYNAAAGIIDVFASKVFDKKFGLNENDIKLALLESAKSNLGLDVNNRQSLKDIINTVKEKLKPENIVNINKRKDFISLGKNNLISKILEQITDTKNVQDLIEFFGKGIKNDKFVGTKTGKLTFANLKQALSYMLNEPILRDEKESDLIYAVLEVPASKDGGDVVTYEKNDSHKSYPYSVVIKDKSAKTTLHILSKKVKWNDYAIDPSTGKTVQKDRLLNIIPTFSGLSVPLSIGSPISKSQKIDEDLSKASGTTQVATTTGSYVKAANILKKLGIDGKVLDYGAGLGLGTDAISIVLGKPVESYEINSERWKGKKPVTYKQSKNIDGKFDAIVSLNVLNVVPRNTRDFIIQDIYNHLKDGGKAIISSRKFKGDIDGAKNFELGPEDKSYIIKKKKDGKIVDVYQKGFDGDELVDYVKEVLGNKVDVKKDNSFGATGVVIEKLPVSKSQKIEEEDNREALRVAGMPYLENTLDVLSTKFGMPYKVVFDESSDETGYIDYDNYGEPTIIVNTANATNDTPLIQYGNIFINQIKNTNKNLFSNLVKQVLNTKEGQAELELAKQRFRNDDYEDQVQQAVVSLLAKYGKNYFDPKTGIHKAIKRIWDTILDFLSKSFNVNINEIPPSTTMEELSKILSHPNISINKTPFSEGIKEEIIEDSKRALKDREKEYLDIKQIPNPSLFEVGDRKIIANRTQFEEFYNTVKEIVDVLKNYKDNQLLVDLTNIKSQISTYEDRDNFNYDRYPLFTRILKFIHPNPQTALWSINNAIEEGRDVKSFINSELYKLDKNLDNVVYEIASGYAIGRDIGVEPPPVYRVYGSLFNSVDEVKEKLESDIELLNEAIKNPELGADYYYRNIRIPVGDDTYTIRGKYRNGNIDISFSSEKFGMADANEGLFFKILPKVIDAISYMYSDVDYDTISFTPVSSDKTKKGTNLRLKGYNIFAKRLFGDFSLLAQDDNTTIIPIPEIFKNRPLTEERTISRSQKVEGEEQAPQKGGPLARIKQAIEKSRKAKAGVGPVSKPVEFEEAEVVPSEKGKEFLFNTLGAPARNIEKQKQLSQGAGSFFNKVKRAAIDTKYDIAKALTKSKTPIGDVARAAMRNAKGYTGASSLVIKLVNSQIFDRLSFAPNIKIKVSDKGKIVETIRSERQLFDAFLDANRIINIDARIRDKFSELVSLSRELKNGIKNDSLTKEEQDELVNQISQLKEYLGRRKALEIKGPDGQLQMIGYQDPDFVYTDKLINLLKEDYAPIQYTHTNGATMKDAEQGLAEMKEQLPELYETFDKMSSDYYDTFRYLLDESLKNGLITKEVYDELWSYNYIPTKFIQHFIEGELAIDNPSKSKKLSASLKNLTGGSEEDVITNYQYIMELYAHATYRRIFDNRAAVKLAQALGKIDPNKFGKDSQFFIQKPNGKDKKGNPTYSDPEKGYDYIKFMVDGVENRIVAPKQFVDIWYDSEFQSSPWLDSTVNFLSKLSLVEFIKGVFTKYAPVFGVTQILLDAPQALISTKAYPDFFLGSVLLAKDYATVAKDVLSIVKNGKPTKFFVEAVQAGVFSDFLSTENDLIKGEKFTNYDGTDNIKNKIKYLASRVNRGVDKTLEAIAKVNEAVEYSTRLAVYYRMKQNLISKFKKDNNGAEPTGQDLENIQLLSAEQSRNVVDFSVGGGVTKQANRLFAYLNSTIQVFVSAARSLKNNPWKAGLMMLEIGAAGTALLAYSLGDLGGEDDEEKKKRYKEYRKRSTYEKESYFLMWTGDPERPFLRIPKPPLFKGLINLFEQAYLHASRGEEFNQEKMWSAFKRDIPFGNPLAELTRNPMINAAFKYFNNYDQFRKENIVKDEEKILDFAETKSATQLYKNIGKASKDLGFKEGVSPKRLQEAVRSFTGDPTKNTWASLFDMGSKGAVALATGDTKELEENFSGNLYADIFKNSGLEGKLFTKPIDYDASFSEQLKEDEKEEYTKKYVIRADVNEIRNNSKDVRSAVKSIYEYLKPKVQSKDIDADYADRVMKQQFKLFGLKDAPEFYDDVAYAKDNDTKAKILNYYLSDMSNAEAGKVMKDMVSKGLLSEEAFLKTINLRAGKK